MHIEINDNTLLSQIQKAFSDFYPYLKIEFYRKPHKEYEVSEEKDLIIANRSIGEIKRTHVSGVLEIQPLYKVADVEREFQDRFDLSVQILRKEKTGWEQTAGMDNFSLRDLNEMGRNSSDEVIISDYEIGFEAAEEKPEKLF